MFVPSLLFALCALPSWARLLPHRGDIAAPKLHLQLPPFKGEVRTLPWLSDRRGKPYGELPDFRMYFDNIEQLDSLVARRSLFPKQDSFGCERMVTISPESMPLPFFLPLQSRSSVCRMLFRASNGSSLSFECPYFSSLPCAQEYFFVTDGQTHNHLYCGGQKPKKISGIDKILLQFERRNQSISEGSAFCIVSATTDAPSQPSTDQYQICPGKCGKASEITGVQRIIGGEKARSGEYPWMAKLRIVHYNKNSFQCGGSVLNSRTILTAAHCLDDEENIDFIEVRVGQTGRQPTKGSQFLRVKEWTVHPKFDRRTLEADIAVLRLPKDLAMSDTVSAICLGPPGTYTNELAVVTGWGTTEETKLSQDLLEVGVTVGELKPCAAAYFLYGQKINEKQLCASAPGKDSCQGDSGGPLVSQIGNRWYEIGLVSFGIGCASETFPGVYTSVPAYNEWIKREAFQGYC